MRVYRVMDLEGKGPYALHDDGRENFPFHDNADTVRPSPVIDLKRDDLDLWDSRNVFGFASVKQLCTWFDAQRRAWLKAHGFSVAVMEAPDASVIHGGHQVAFPAPDVELVKVCDLDELTP